MQGVATLDCRKVITQSMLDAYGKLKSFHLSGL